MRIVISRVVIAICVVSILIVNTAASAEEANKHGLSYSVSRNIGVGAGEIYYLINKDGVWSVVKTADLSDKNVEMVSVDTVQKVIQLQANKAESSLHYDVPSWKCYKETRERNGYSICTSNFSESYHSVDTLLVTALTLASWSFVQVDQQKLLDVAVTSGLLEAAEREYQFKVNDANKKEADLIEPREKAEQEKLTMDKQADQGDASAKYKRALFYLGADSYNEIAGKWFAKAADAGSADAMYKQGVFQSQAGNEVEAENLWKKAAQGGCIDARVALEKLIAERNRLAAQQKFNTEQQAQERKQIIAFRKSISDGVETNCGPVIYVKGTLVKVSFPVKDYGNEHWVRKDIIFPARYSCRFVNGQYQPPE